MEDEELDNLSNQIMALPGMDTSRESYVLIEEDGGELFMKFMSYGGVTDNENGKKLHEMFVKANVEHEYFYERKFRITVEELKLFLRSKS